MVSVYWALAQRRDRMGGLILRRALAWACSGAAVQQ